MTRYDTHDMNEVVRDVLGGHAYETNVPYLPAVQKALQNASRTAENASGPREKDLLQQALAHINDDLISETAEHLGRGEFFADPEIYACYLIAEACATWFEQDPAYGSDHNSPLQAYEETPGRCHESDAYLLDEAANAASQLIAN